MIGRSYVRRFAPGLVAVALLGGAASAQHHEKILGKDDIEFANALARARYDDLAEAVYTALSTVRGGSGETALVVELQKLNSKEKEAGKLTDPIQRAEALFAVVELMEQFVESHPGSEVAADLQDQLPDKYRNAGESSALAVSANPDAPGAKELREKGSAMFERAVSSLRKQIDLIDEQRKAREEPDEKLEFDYMLARYNLARTFYFNALVMDPNGNARKDPLKRSLSILSDFELDYSNELCCYEGFIYAGLCHIELGDLDKAEQSFDSAIKLRERFDVANDGVFLMQENQNAINVVSAGVLQKMLLLVKKGDNQGAVATSRDYYKTIPDAVRGLKGLAILAQEADCHRALGDSKSLEAVARRMIDADPRGPAGARGRELLGESGGSNLSASDMLNLAKETYNRNDVPRAIEICQQTIVMARGRANEADIGSEAANELGKYYAYKEQWFEAVTAWEAAAERFQAGATAAECLYRAANGYLKLLKTEKREYYKTRARARMTELTKRYPTSSYVGKAALMEGDMLYAEGEFARAADMFEKIPVISGQREEALYRAGNSWASLARKATADGKTGDAASASKKAEELFKRAATEADDAVAKTLDTNQQNYLRGVAFSARMGLANLYLLDKARVAEVLQLFGTSSEREYASVPEWLNAARGVRLRAMMALGRIDDAIAMVDALIKENPDASFGSVLAPLARALDTRGVDMRKQGKNSEADIEWRRAAKYYWLAIKGQVAGSERVNAEDLESSADRLLVFALHFNRIPVDSFTEWTGGRLTEDDLFDQAARAFEAVFPSKPTNKVVVRWANCLAFLGRWEEAAAKYADLFARVPVIDINKSTINSQVLSGAPELLSACLEWGVCEREAGLAKSENARLNRTVSIFTTLANGTTPGGKLWWQSKYYQLRTMTDQGTYDLAEVAVRALERSNPDFDNNEFGLKDRFVKLREELARKGFK